MFFFRALPPHIKILISFSVDYLIKLLPFGCKIGSLASYILGLLTVVTLLLCEPGLSDVDHVITLNIDKNADHTRFIVEKHVIDDIFFYVYYPRLGFQVESVYIGCFKGWIKNFDLKSDFCYALANYDYIHDDGLFYEIGTATAAYSRDHQKVILQCPKLKDHLIRASIVLKYIKETHYFDKSNLKNVITEVDKANYQEPPGYVRNANSIDVSDSLLTIIHFGSVGEFVDSSHSQAHRASQNQAESNTDGASTSQRVPEESSSHTESNQQDSDRVTVIETPRFAVSITDDYHSHTSESQNANSASNDTRPHSPTLAPIAEEEDDDPTLSLSLDPTSTIDQQETSTDEMNTEGAASAEDHFENDADKSSEESISSVQPATELTGAEDYPTSDQLDSEQVESEDSASIELTQSTTEDVCEQSVSEFASFTVPNDNQSVSEDPVESSDFQYTDGKAARENQVTEPSGTNEQESSTDQPGSAEAITEEPSHQVTSTIAHPEDNSDLSESGEKIESAEITSQDTTFLAESESTTDIAESDSVNTTVLPETDSVLTTVTVESEPNENVETSSVAQEESQATQAQDSELNSSQCHSEINTSQDTSIVQSESPGEEDATVENEIQTFTEPNASEDSTSLQSGPPTSEIGEQAISEYSTSPTFAEPYTEAVADESNQQDQQNTANQQEQPTIANQQEQLADVSLEQEVESTQQPDSTTAQVQPQYTSTENNTEHTPSEDSNISIDQDLPTVHTTPLEGSFEDSGNSLLPESSTDQPENTELTQSPSHTSEQYTEPVQRRSSTFHIDAEPTSTMEDTSKSNLRAADPSENESPKSSGHSDPNDKDVDEITSESLENKPELLSNDQQSTPSQDGCIWL
nr:hypothetical protein MACL_00001293 [Theileria orientalis]